MTLDEADQIIAELNLCFPSKQLLVEEVKRWEENLAPFSYEDAKKVVRHIENTCKFWPAWAEFREGLMPLENARRLAQITADNAVAKALEAPPSDEDREKIRGIINQIKRNMSARD